MKITLQQLKVFSTVAREGNIGHAAQRLFLSKGAVSQTIQQLESRLSTCLFDRVHPKLQINAQGHMLRPLADELLARAEEIESLFTPDSLLEGHLHLGASQTIGNYVLPLLLPKQSRNGQQQTSVTIANSQTLCHKLLNFELDMALIEGQNIHQELLATPWIKDEMLLVTSPEHPLAQKKQILLSDLNDQAWVLREAASGSREQFEHLIRPSLEHLSSVLELSSLEAVMLGVENGLGISFISRLALKDRLQSARLVALPVKARFIRQLFLVWHKKKYHSGRLDSFCRFLLNDALSHSALK